MSNASQTYNPSGTIKTIQTPLEPTDKAQTTASVIHGNCNTGGHDEYIDVKVTHGGALKTESEVVNVAGDVVNPATEDTLGEIASTVVSGTSGSTTPSINTQPKETETFAWSFADEVASGVDTTQGTVIKTGAGMAVSQANGNLLITTGVTPYSETIIRANQTLKGRFRFEYALALSQRIANNNFAIELVDIIGDGLTMENTAANRIIVTIPSHGYTSADIGKTIYVCAITGMSALPQSAIINAITDSNRIRLAVSGFPGAGAFGTCTLYGWSSHTIVYNGTSATALGGGYGTTRKGRPTSPVSGTINTTASGHMGILEAFKPFDSTYLDQVLGTGTGTQPSSRVMVNQNLPPDDANLTVQIRVWNGSTAPATTTTTTFGFLRYERVNPLNVAVAGVQALSAKNPMPVNVNNTITATVSTTTNIPATAQGSSTNVQYISAATTNANLVKASAGVINHITWANSSASWRYLKIFNLATAPVPGTSTPIHTIGLPPGQAGVASFGPFGMRNATGTGIAITGGIQANDATAILANEVSISISYT